MGTTAMMTASSGADSRPRTALRLGADYATGLAFAHLLTSVEAILVVLSLSGETPTGADILLRPRSLILTAVLVGLGTLAVVISGTASIAGSLRWYTAGRQPDAAQRHAALHIVRRQSAIVLGTWVLGGAIGLAALRTTDVGLLVLLAMVVVFGGTATVSTSMLFTHRTFRPIVAAAWRETEIRENAPGVLPRLVSMWFITCALPAAAIVILIVCRRMGWIIDRTASVETPVLVLCLVAVLLGVRAMILVARSISDPVGEVVSAMARVQHGEMDVSVGIYEHSEIGRLQTGFNRMVAGLRERDRLQDLFGRHVGSDVARLAVERDLALSADVQEAAILFIDLVGSTELAATHPPDEVAGVLNDFFRIVVAAVDAQHGSINKFQGDAVLAVFGAPVASDDAAAAALATARTLLTQLRRLPLVDFGIGVSAGPVFAGNIGSENRYEYTVVGDAVNEAARLADRAKTVSTRALCSASALEGADESERSRWVSHGSAVLRGRAQPTVMSTPTAEHSSGPATGV
jgi:class 3 adenylate cyclase